MQPLKRSAAIAAILAGSVLNVVMADTASQPRATSQPWGVSDEELFSALDLASPGLETVEKAVADGD